MLLFNGKSVRILRMKYVVLIMDGAADWPLKQHGGKTCLELAKTPNLDWFVNEGRLGLTTNVPKGMEPSSAIACMSVLGFDPEVYYRGRAGIEAKSMGISVGKGDVVFRCNLVTVRDGKMLDYSAGHISTGEAKEIIQTIEEKLGSDKISFYPGVNYRHILKIKGAENSLGAECTPPHDISGKPVADYLPKGPGSEILLDLMKRSEPILQNHPVNLARKSRGELPATTIWLFWATGQIPDMPSFKSAYGVSGAMTSGVDLLRGLAQMASMDILEIKGVTDGPDNDYAGQASGALAALDKHDLVVIHVESPDEAGHSGHVEEKIKAIEKIDSEVLGRIRARKDELRLLVLPDHPTPIEIRTHSEDPVPFLLWGHGFQANGAKRFTEAEAKKTGLFLTPGYNIMSKLTGRA
jgi:2,3-bisphosphoglycerate-independent phosphoglycerate mutase